MKKSKFKVMSLVIALFILLVSTGCELNTKSNNSTTPTDGKKTTPTVTPTTNTSVYKVKLDGFTFSIPDSMMYEEADGELLIGDEAGTWVADLLVADGNYNQLKNNKGQLQSYFQQNGFTANPAEVKSLGGTEFITIEMVKGGVNLLGAYAKLNSMKTAWIAIYNQANTYDYDLLTKMASVISTAAYSDTSNSIAANPNIKFNMDEMSQFAK